MRSDVANRGLSGDLRLGETSLFRLRKDEEACECHNALDFGAFHEL
jgi:hypothetical protein